mmetsp:Transcript_14312/g.34807  ORF Transcript_14312/g.34807 Transcript_14312/m.34807 type:complete len:215 (+) Transcript_14312:1365-2009(+)
MLQGIVQKERVPCAVIGRDDDGAEGCARRDRALRVRDGLRPQLPPSGVFGREAVVEQHAPIGVGHGGAGQRKVLLGDEQRKVRIWYLSSEHLAEHFVKNDTPFGVGAAPYRPDDAEHEDGVDGGGHRIVVSYATIRRESNARLGGGGAATVVAATVTFVACGLCRRSRGVAVRLDLGADASNVRQQALKEPHERHREVGLGHGRHLGHPLLDDS